MPAIPMYIDLRRKEDTVHMYKIFDEFETIVLNLSDKDTYGDKKRITDDRLLSYSRTVATLKQIHM